MFPLSWQSIKLINMLLSDTKIRNSKPKQKSYSLNDGEGLKLIVRPNGSKTWQYRYRYAEREKTISFGKYPSVRLIDARDKKIEAQRQLRENIDPSTAKKKEKLLAAFRENNSFYEVAKEWREKNRDSWTLGYDKDTWNRLRNHVFPSLGKRPIGEILPLELLAAIKKIEARGKTDMSHRVLRICSSVYDYAVLTQRSQYNVTAGLSKALKSHRTKNYHPTLSAKEVPSFLLALENLEASQQNKLAFRFLLLTAVRTGELRFSKWSDIDFEAREWHVRAEITKMRTAHRVPLSRQSLQVLYELHEITGHSEWLVPSQCGWKHEVMSENTINDMIHRMGYRGRIVGHGFRALFSTVLNEHGFNPDAIERQLAHMERNKVRAAYNRAEYMAERVELMKWWGNWVDRQTVKLLESQL